jgi:hypothetical protein
VCRVYLVGVDLECRWKAWAENPDASKGYILDEYFRRLSDLGPSHTWSLDSSLMSKEYPNNGSIARESSRSSPLTPPRRTTRFQPLVRRYWTGFYPQGSYERFLSATLHLIPLSQASLGAI